MVTVTVSPPEPSNWPSPEVWSYALNLPHDPRAPRIARRTLRAVLSAYRLDQLADTAELLASELVTNAFRHTQGPSALRLRNLEGAYGVRVGVWDTNPHIPPPFDSPPTALRPLPPTSETGRGLHLVRQWATTWGAYPLGDELFGKRGKVLWVELTPPADTHVL
ncbi:ATP-binding protein [Streptomyces sp. NPDC050659]